MESKYPEHDKLTKVQKESQAIGEFLEWLNSKDRVICQWYESDGTDEEEVETRGYFPLHLSIERLLAEHFNIDLNKIEQEKRQMLDEIRKANENR